MARRSPRCFQKSSPSKSHLLGNSHLDQVTRISARHHPQDSPRSKPPYGPADGRVAEAGGSGEPGNGKVDANFSLKTAMAKQMKIDRTVDLGQPETRHHEVLDLLAHLFSIGFFVFHVFIVRKLRVDTYS